MESKNANNTLTLVKPKKRKKPNKYLGCTVPQAITNYDIPEEYKAVREKYGLPPVMPGVLKSTLVAKIMKVSRPTAIKLLKQMQGVSVGTNLKRHHLRIEAPLFLTFLQKNMDGNSKLESTGN